MNVLLAVDDRDKTETGRAADHSTDATFHLIEKLHATGHRVAVVTIDVAVAKDADSTEALGVAEAGARASHEKVTLYCVRPVEAAPGNTGKNWSASALTHGIVEGLTRDQMVSPHFFTNVQSLDNWVDKVVAAQVKILGDGDNAVASLGEVKPGANQ